MDPILNKVFENGFKPRLLDEKRKGAKRYEGVCSDCKEKRVFSYAYLMRHVKPVCKECLEKHADPILHKTFENGFKPRLLDEKRKGRKQYGGICPDCKEEKVFSYPCVSRNANPICEDCRDKVSNKVFENGFKPRLLDEKRNGAKQYEGVCPDCKEKVVFSYNYLMCHVKPVCKKCRETRADSILHKTFENSFKPHLLDEKRKGKKQYSGICPDCKEKRVFSYAYLMRHVKPVCKECLEKHADPILHKTFENSFKPHLLDERHKGKKQYGGVCPDCKEKVVFLAQYLKNNDNPVCEACLEKRTDTILHKTFENGFKPHLLDEKREGKKQYEGVCPDCKVKVVFTRYYLMYHINPVCEECRKRFTPLESKYHELTNRHKLKKAPGDVVLTFEQNNALRINGRCVYSNELGPRKLAVIDGKKETINYIGLDRKDSKHGYTLENSTPCSGWMNRAKHTMSTASFMKKIKTLIKHQLKVMPEEEFQEIVRQAINDRKN